MVGIPHVEQILMLLYVLRHLNQVPKVEFMHDGRGSPLSEEAVEVDGYDGVVAALTVDQREGHDG